MIPIGKYSRRLSEKQTGADRQAAAQTFRRSYYVRRNTISLIRIHIPRSAVSRLYFIHNKQYIVCLTIFNSLSDKVFIEFMYAAFSLNEFHHHRAGLIRNFFLYGFKDGLCIRETFGKRTEIFMECVLSRRGKRCQRPSVKTVFQGNDFIAAIIAVFHCGIFSCRLYRTLVLFGPGISEKDFLCTRFFAQEPCKFHLGLRIIQIAGMLYFVQLRDYGLFPKFVVHAEDIDAYPARKIYIFLAFTACNRRAIAAFYRHGETVIRGRYIFLVFPFYFRKIHFVT